MNDKQVMAIVYVSAAIFLVSITVLTCAVAAALDDFSTTENTTGSRELGARDAVQTTPTPLTKCVITTRSPALVSEPGVAYTDVWYNATTPETVQAFLDIVPDCDWFAPDAGNMCSSNARYPALEAQNHGIVLNEVTFEYVTDTCGGHRVLFFDHDGTTYYVTNLNISQSWVMTRNDLDDKLREVIGDDNASFRLVNHKYCGER